MLLLDEEQALSFEGLPFGHLGVLRLHLELVDRLVERRGVLAKPRVSSNVLDRAAVGWVGDEHLEEELSRLGGDPVGEGEGGVDDVLVEEVDIVAFRVGRIVVVGEVAGEHGVEDDAATPHVDRRSDVLALLDDELGRCVAGRAARRRHQVAPSVVEAVGESEVGHDDLAAKSSSGTR